MLGYLRLDGVEHAHVFSDLLGITLSQDAGALSTLA